MGRRSPLGLYQRALIIFKSLSQSKSLATESDTDSETGITPEEREKFAAEIDEITKKNRIELKPDTFEFVPERTGAFLPVAINAVAFLIILTGVFLFSMFFNLREISIVRAPTTLLTAESELIAALRQDSQEKLSAKEEEIARIQAQMAQVSKQRDELRQAATAQSQEKECLMQSRQDARKST